MSGREWKPGDVAMVRRGTANWHRAIWTDETDNPGWHCIHGPCSPHVEDARPLVVIDPEDPQQVERLRRAINDETAGYVGTRTITDALHEFANPTPPKPEEPTGLGAVVEDADGVRFVLHGIPEGQGWCDPDGIGRRWGSINAVRVLSEGVS